MTQLSVIIATHNRAGKLRECLLALAGQSLPPSEFEVIVVVDGSTDNTGAMLAQLLLPFKLNVYWQENSGQSAALNRGLAKAVGPYCLILDDDVIATPGLADAHLSAQLGQKGVAGIGQLIQTLPAHADEFARALTTIWNNHYSRLNQGRPPAWTDAYSGNLSAPRTAFLAAGAFAVDLPAGFDIELSYRLQRHGLSFVYLPGATGMHDDYKDFHRIAADMEKHGRAAVEICRRHPPALADLLGNFGETTVGAIWLRRWLLAFHVPWRVLAWISKAAENLPEKFGWYPFLHNYFFWRGVRQATPDRETWHRLTSRTPILMYHAFAGAQEPASRFVIPRRKFAVQMAWLSVMGYHVLSLEDYLCWRNSHQLPPAHSVVITIDDGYAELHAQVFPLLRRYAFPAIIFVASATVGDANRWDDAGPLVGRPILSWAQIKEMLEGGISFGAHSRTHPLLISVSPDQAEDEIVGSRAALERELKVSVRSFAYPYGGHDAVTERIVQAAGFVGACSTRPGANTLSTPRYALHRTEVFGTDSIIRFALALWLGDDHLPPRRENT